MQLKAELNSQWTWFVPVRRSQQDTEACSEKTAGPLFRHFKVHIYRQKNSKNRLILLHSIVVSRFY